jgi:hypothetical protein
MTLQAQTPGAEALAFLPAHPCLLDTTVWHHRWALSAMESTRGPDGQLHPALLWFQVDPFWELIAQADSVDDLWSGSFLISWLMAEAIQAVTDQLGPDCILFPWLRGQPLYDRLNRQKIDAARISLGMPMPVDQELGLEHRAEWILRSTLPNQFLALVPANFDVSVVANVFQAESKKGQWRQIADACWEWLVNAGQLGASQRRQWEWQIAHLWHLSWQLWPWQSVEETITLMEKMPGVTGTTLKLWQQVASALTPETRKDLGSSPYPDWTWSAQFQLATHRLEARLQTCDFTAWPIAVGPGTHAQARSSHDMPEEKEFIGIEGAVPKSESAAQPDSQVSPPDRCDAFSQIKLVWPTVCLTKLGLGSGDRDFAATNLLANGRGAVLVMDADHVQRWLSGEKAPPVQRVYAPTAIEQLRRQLTQSAGLEPWLASPRLPSLPWHLQFSEAMANFSLYSAPRVVEVHHGRLIYAGGDTMVAVLPAREVVDCACGLRLAYQGASALATVDSPYKGQFAPTEPGFVKLAAAGRQPGEPAWPLLAPGANATCSVGAALGPSCLSPQALFKHALAALAHAKAKPVRPVTDRVSGQTVEQVCPGWNGDALVITLLNAPGQTLHWGAKFNSPAFALHGFIQQHCRSGPENPRPEMLIGTRFFGRLAAMLSRYAAHEPLTPELVEIAERELAWAIQEQADRLSVTAQETLRGLVRDYLVHLLQFSWEQGGETKLGPRPLQEFIDLLLLETYFSETLGMPNDLCASIN